MTVDLTNGSTKQDASLLRAHTHTHIRGGTWKVYSASASVAAEWHHQRNTAVGRLDIL